MEQPVNDDLVPLLDSVAGLLEKERELGELKLEAAQHEGQQWRERYERLKGSLPEGDEGFVERPPNGPPPRLSAWELLNELHDPNVRRQMAVAQSLALQRMMRFRSSEKEATIIPTAPRPIERTPMAPSPRSAPTRRR